MPGTVNHLRIRVERSDRSEDQARLMVLIDGADLLARGTGCEGPDPDEILDSGALIPAEPARRVALYGCDCGGGFGCACVAPVIREENGFVTWTDFRNESEANSPLPPENDLDATGDADSPGQSLPIADLVFDAAAYRAEVARAVEDRSWESRRRAVVRLLRQELARHDGYWTRLGTNPPIYVGLDDPVDLVLVQFDWKGLLHVWLPTGSGDPGRTARNLADYLVRTPPTEWNATRSMLTPPPRPGPEVR